MKAMQLVREIYSRSELGCTAAGSSCSGLLLPAVNTMRAIATTRMVAQHTHAPWIIVMLMCVLTTSGAALAGYALSARRARQWMHTVLFIGTLIATVFVILDLEFPREGLIRLEAADAAMTELRNSMR